MAKTITSICTLYKLNKQSSGNDRTATHLSPAATATRHTQQFGKDTSAYNYRLAFIVELHYLTLISPLASDERVFEFGDFPMMAFFAFTSDCFTFDIMLFDCF